MELTLLNHQPEFPEQDLTQTNAAFFEFFLQNGTLLEASHSGAEQSNLLFNLAHLAATHSKDTFIDDGHHAGFTHGFTLYEIMSSLIAPRTDYFTDVTALAATRSLNIALRTKKQDELFNDARDEFRSVQPIAAEVIGRAAERYYPGIAHYAVMGAAIERQFELEARDFQKSIVQ